MSNIQMLCTDLLDGLASIDKIAKDQASDLSSLKEPLWWTKVAAFLLSGNGQSKLVAANANLKYPGPGSKQFDLFVQLADGEKVYVEGKGAWKTYWKNRKHLGKFNIYLYSPLGGHRSQDKEKSAARDLRKLITNLPEDATHAIQVLIGSAYPSDDVASDLDRYAELALLNEPPWHSATRQWPNPQHPEIRQRCSSVGLRRRWACGVVGSDEGEVLRSSKGHPPLTLRSPLPSFDRVS